MLDLVRFIVGIAPSCFLYVVLSRLFFKIFLSTRTRFVLTWGKGDAKEEEIYDDLLDACGAILQHPGLPRRFSMMDVSQLPGIFSGPFPT